MSASVTEHGKGGAVDSRAPNLRVCPTQAGEARSLITHLIDGHLCLKRQREYYHKCHRCVFRGQPIDFVRDDGSRNGASK